MRKVHERWDQHYVNPQIPQGSARKVCRHWIWSIANLFRSRMRTRCKVRHIANKGRHIGTGKGRGAHPVLRSGVEQQSFARTFWHFGASPLPPRATRDEKTKGIQTTHTIRAQSHWHGSCRTCRFPPSRCDPIRETHHDHSPVSVIAGRVSAEGQAPLKVSGQKLLSESSVFIVNFVGGFAVGVVRA